MALEFLPGFPDRYYTSLCTESTIVPDEYGAYRSQLKEDSTTTVEDSVDLSELGPFTELGSPENSIVNSRSIGKDSMESPSDSTRARSDYSSDPRVKINSEESKNSSKTFTVDDQFSIRASQSTTTTNFTKTTSAFTAVGVESDDVTEKYNFTQTPAEPQSLYKKDSSYVEAIGIKIILFKRFLYLMGLKFEI